MDINMPADSSEKLHPWVVLTEACLNKTKPDSDGLIRPEKLKRLNVCVSKASIRRSMLIWNHILKAVEGKFKLRMEAEYGKRQAPYAGLSTPFGRRRVVGTAELSPEVRSKNGFNGV